MATVTVQYPIPSPPPPEYVLTLTQREAEVLRLVMRLVAGHPEDTARGVTDAIDQALAGVKVSPARDRHKGSISF